MLSGWRLKAHRSSYELIEPLMAARRPARASPPGTRRALVPSLLLFLRAVARMLILEMGAARPIKEAK
jgi:hypothetical protein